MAKNTINLISSVSNDYSTLIKVKLNGEEVVLVGKQNFAFNKPYSFDSFREKHANFLKTLHSFPKSYFTERNDDAKKDVLIPSIKSYNVAQVGNKFITLNNISNNPIIYNGNIGRIFGAYYYDTNDFIYGTLNYDVLEKYVNYGIDDETFKNNILKYLKDNLYNNPTPTKANGDVITSYDELQDYEYGAALERPRKGYPVIENVKGLTIYGDLDYIDPNSTEAPTNSFYEIDDNWIWNTADNKSPKPVFTNFSRLQNNLSPLSQPELTFETSTPQFRMWRKYHNMGINDSNNLWLSYNLELARSSRIELNPWRTGPDVVSPVDDESETVPTLQLEDEYKPPTTLAYENSENFVSTIGKQFEQSLFNGYSFFISFDGSIQAIGKPMIKIKDGSTDVPLFSVLHNPLQQLFLYGEKVDETTNISSSVISSWSNEYISNYLDEANEYVESSINTIIPKNDSTQSLMYNITMDNNINSGDYINNNNQVIIRTNSTLSLNNIITNGISFKFTAPETSGSLKFSNIAGDFKETFKTEKYNKPSTIPFDSSINLNSETNRKLAFKGTVNIDSFNFKTTNPSITLTNTSNSNDKLTVKLSANDSINFSIKLSDGKDEQIINNTNTGGPTEFAMFGNTITITGVNSIYTNYTDRNTEKTQPISIIYDETKFSCIYDDKTYTCSTDAVEECFENITITINASGFIEDFYLHPLNETTNIIPRILVDNNTIEFGKLASVNSSGTHTVNIPNIKLDNNISFNTDIFGSQFALTLGGDIIFNTVDDVDVSEESSFIISNNIYATISTDKKTLYCTIVGEGFDKSPLDNIININTSFKPTNNVLYTPSSSNTLNYIADKSELDNADDIKKDSDIYNVLKHNLFKRFLKLLSTKPVATKTTEGDINELPIDSYVEVRELVKKTVEGVEKEVEEDVIYYVNKCYVTFVLDQINSKPIELYNSADGLKPIHTFTTKELVTQLELAPGTYNFKYSDEASIGANNSLNNNFAKIYVEYYSYPEDFDDETFNHIINDYTEFKHKKIELTSSPTSIFNSSLTSQCVILQDISNIEESVSITIKDKSGEYKLFLDEALIIGSTDMSQVCAASNYEGTLLDVYYTVFNSKNIEQYSNLHFSKVLNIATSTSGSISTDAIIQSKDSSTGNILNLYGKYSETNKYSIGSGETVIYEQLQLVSPSKKHIISGVDYGLYLKLSTTPSEDCKLLIDNNEICDIDGTITNIRFSTLGYNITSEQITLSNYSGTVNEFIVYPLYTNYFPSISGFSNKLLTDTSKSSVYSAKIHIVPNSKFTNTNVIRNLFSYDSLMSVTDTRNTNTTTLDRQTISYSSELQYYVHEPKLTEYSNEDGRNDWNNLRDNLNNNVITNYDLNVKSIFGGFSVYDDKVVVTDPLLRSYNYAELSSIGFVIEFNDDKEFEGNEITIKTFINGNIVDATFNSKYDGSDTSALWKKLYKNLNYGNLTITYGETPSKIHAVRSWNYALDDSVFNMLHNQFSLYQDVSTINNEIYEYKFYDTENRLGDWVLTDESVFTKTPVIFEIKELDVSLNYILTKENKIEFNVVLNYSIQNTIYNYKWYRNNELYDNVEDKTSNTITIEKDDVENGEKWYVVVTYGHNDTSYTSNTVIVNTSFDASLYVNGQIYENESTIDIIRYNNIDIYVEHPNNDNNDNLTYIWSSKKLYPAENIFTDIANNTEKQITVSNLENSCAYKCTITNSYGVSIEKTVNINVVLNIPIISCVESGDNYKFTCETEPDSTDTTGIEIVWYKDGIQLDSQSNNTGYPYTYTISKTEAEDCKFYAIVTFENSKTYTSNTISIDSEKNITSPVISDDLPTTKTLTEGDNLELSITLMPLTGNITYGTVEYEIYKGDNLVEAGELLEEELSESNYTITYTKNNLTTNDSGSAYKIRLWNSITINAPIISNTCNIIVNEQIDEPETPVTPMYSTYYVSTDGTGSGLSEDDPAYYKYILTNNISNDSKLTLKFLPGTYTFDSGISITENSNLNIANVNPTHPEEVIFIFNISNSIDDPTKHAFNISSDYSYLRIHYITIKYNGTGHIIYANGGHLTLWGCIFDRGTIYLSNLLFTMIIQCKFSGTFSQTFPEISIDELKKHNDDENTLINDHHNTFNYVLSSYSLARNSDQNTTENITYKVITDINEINYDTDVIAVRFSPWQTQYNKFDVKYDYEDSEKGSDNHRLFLIKDYDYLDRFAGLYRLDNGEGRASNLYSIKISNSGFATNNYVPGTDDYELQELMNTTCKAALDNAIVSLTKKIQPINTQLFKVIYDDPGFTS